MIFTLTNLCTAYRKAKVDLYYSTHASVVQIAEYEQQLLDNLQSLLERLEGQDENWINDDTFLGTWMLAAKTIRRSKGKAGGTGLIFSSPVEEWQHDCEQNANDEATTKPVAEFRLMAQAGLDFHVLSALWMLHVGHRYDAKLSACAFGNRLRRKQDGGINPLSLGSFEPYLKPFRTWRDNGIDAMRTALESNKDIVALTADISAFYHELNPGFMLDERFNRLLELELSPEEQKLHRLFIRALQAWAQKTPLKKGLPVGLPASAVVANSALIELDHLVEQQVAPLYYGRYVDDILLVMENGAGFRSTAELWQWLFDRTNGKLSWVDNEQKEIQFCPAYLSDSHIRFSNSKNKVFLLTGETGRILVDSIAYQIHERASEWRALPNLPELASQVGTDLVAATQSNGEAADNLRKADALTMRRAGFAIKLRDFEAYERDLPPEAWKAHRHAFFRAFVQHVLVLPQFFELAVYLPRVVRLATACEDFEHLRKILRGLERICATVGECCVARVKSCPDDNAPDSETVVEYWKGHLFGAVEESIVAAFPPRLSNSGKMAWRAHLANSGLPIAHLGIKEIQALQSTLFSLDLAHMPFRFIGMPKEMISQRGIPSRKMVMLVKDATQVLPSAIIDGVTTLSNWTGFSKGLPHGFLFATRPFNLTELFVLARDPFSTDCQQAMKAVVLALRGFVLSENSPQFDSKGVLQIPYVEDRLKHTIAVSSWQTRYDSWIASVMQSSDPDLGRYARLTRLVNSVMSQPKTVHYFVLPELALPAHWFMRIAQKLQGRGISLITGIEYLHASKDRVRNQVWAALSHDGLGFPSTMIYRQDKQRPALHEELELQRLAGVDMKPDRSWKTPPIVQHGSFRFALLVCSELTNISHRAALRGDVDALFVPEWNQDTETFNALVESAALDIHAYVIQCNDRQYGDSRIRAPHKDSWRRDVLRVKGGIEDYCVTGEIDVQALRQFQSSHRSPNGPFKPVPDGFSINHFRRMLPT
ncbi:hypothetical protein OKW49_005324 [Paraburkholderia youngii]|uniref:reverse transcriptase domain-containing protein n=1 Tax=Paraburkholderia youngii TaxID=2782701 RepID=UPI003D20D838